jgi:hypothetical protein
MSKQLWKLIGVVGMLAIAAGCSRSPVASSNLPETASVPNPVRTATWESPATAPKVWMTDFQPISGTPYLYAPIYIATAEQRQSISKQIKSAVANRSYDDNIDIRNYMFVHRDNLSATKLLANNTGRIIELEQLGEPSPPPKSGKISTSATVPQKVTTFWYKKVTADTNGDKTLDGRDRLTIALSDVSGANYTEIIKDIDKIILIYPKGINRRLVIYATGTKHFVADVDIPKRTATIKELPSVN